MGKRGLTMQTKVIEGQRKFKTERKILYKKEDGVKTMSFSDVLAIKMTAKKTTKGMEEELDKLMDEMAKKAEQIIEAQEAPR